MRRWNGDEAMRHDRISTEPFRNPRPAQDGGGRNAPFETAHSLQITRDELRLGAASPNRMPATTFPKDAPLLLPNDPETRAAWRRTIIRQSLVLVALIGLAVVLRDRILALDFAAIFAALKTVAAPQWALALLATAISYWSLGQYDAVIHRALKTGMPPRAASTAGAAAIAISQTVGFGLVSGALVRWRLSPGLSLVQASKITAIVAVSFLIGWAGVTGAVLLVLPVKMAGAGTFGIIGCAGALAALTLSLTLPKVNLFRREITLPSPRFMTRILTLAALDTLAAGCALWALLPPGSGPEFTGLFPAFLLALGAGFVAGTPAGVGPFEVTFLALLPGIETSTVLAAVIAWRGVYFALPAVIAGIAITVKAVGNPHPKTAQQRTDTPCRTRRKLPFTASIRATPATETDTAARAATARAARTVAPPATELTPRLQSLIERAPRAELGLLRQGEHSVLLAGNARAGWMIGHARQTLIGLLDPFGAPERGLAAALLPRLTELARSQGRIACLYKINARTAATARKLGWTIAPVAREAWLPPITFDLTTPARAGLRRKLRKAHKSGLRVICAEGELPIAQMTQISEAWVRSRGHERGFSMGRYTPDYVSAQRVYLALNGEELLGFASFHEGAAEWVLDLMRPRDDAPDGTMHALICAAIEDAKAFGIARLSLAALPPESDQTSGPAAIVWRRAETQKGAAGLKQFKSAFAPEWQTLYIAARGAARLTVAAADIAHAIRRPPALKSAANRPQALARGPASGPHAVGHWLQAMATGDRTSPSPEKDYAPRSRPS